jgi:hypothetical protein
LAKGLTCACWAAVDREALGLVGGSVSTGEAEAAGQALAQVVALCICAWRADVAAFACVAIARVALALLGGSSISRGVHAYGASLGNNVTLLNVVCASSACVAEGAGLAVLHGAASRAGSLGAQAADALSCQGAVAGLALAVGHGQHVVGLGLGVGVEQLCGAAAAQSSIVSTHIQ